MGNLMQNDLTILRELSKFPNGILRKDLESKTDLVEGKLTSFHNSMKRLILYKLVYIEELKGKGSPHMIFANPQVTKLLKALEYVTDV